MTSSLQEHEGLKFKYEKVLKEHSEATCKFKLLEQIHLEAVGEFERQQASMYHQLESMSSRLTNSELELNARLAAAKQQQEASLEQIAALTDQVNKFKDKCKLQEGQIDCLYKRLEAAGSLVGEHDPADKESGWNREVKSLDARITDVLGKLKERELSLSSTSSLALSPSGGGQSTEEANRLKCDRLQTQLNEAQQKIAFLSSQLKQQEASNRSTLHNKGQINIQDFGDDLAKVLMSKEEVITQLERQLKDKEKQLQSLVQQLNDQISTASQYEDVLSLEHEKYRLLNNELKSLNDENSSSSEAISTLSEQLANANAATDALQAKLTQANLKSEALTAELNNAAEVNRNELDTMQEEIKTLEYKLVHSQRQAQEYQSILEDMDLANTCALNFMQQMGGNSACLTQIMNETSNSLSGIGQNASIQSKLKRNQLQLQLLSQQLVYKRCKELEELQQLLNKTQAELNEVKEENLDLNDHIYSIDVFMREKDAQCDQYQREKDELAAKLHDISQTSSNQTSKILFDNKHMLNESNKENMRHVKTALKKLIELVNSKELMQFNSQIVSYMGEQLVHKSALNGSLKFACDLLRKKYAASQSTEHAASHSLLIECKHLMKSGNGGGGGVGGGQLTCNNEQDEKIFKLASELLLSDESSLRKLSAQVLNEAQHLTELNFVLNALRKIRWKHLKLRTKDSIEQTLKDVRGFTNTDSQEAQVESGGSGGGFETDSDLSETESDSNELEDETQLEQKLNYILNGKKNVLLFFTSFMCTYHTIIYN